MDVLGSLRWKSQVSVTYIIQLLRSMSCLCALFMIPFLCGVPGVAMFVLVTRQEECGDWILIKPAFQSSESGH